MATHSQRTQREDELAQTREIVERTRIAQGLPPRVTDPAIVADAAAVFEAAADPAREPDPVCRCAENAAWDAALHGELPYRCAACGEPMWHPTPGITTPLYGCIACYRRR